MKGKHHMHFLHHREIINVYFRKHWHMTIVSRQKGLFLLNYGSLHGMSMQQSFDINNFGLVLNFSITTYMFLILLLYYRSLFN